MAVYQGSGPPTVLACNANSDRGWNDPPTLAFAASTSSSSTPRKRLDLRKRVAHDFFSGSGVNSGMANLSLSQRPPVQDVHGQQNTYHQNHNPTLNPMKSSTLPVNGAYPPSMTHNVNQPPLMTGTHNHYGAVVNGHPPMQSAYGGHSPMPFQGSMTPPIFQPQQHNTHLAHAASMPNLNGHFSRNTATQPMNPQSNAPPLFNVNNPPQQVATIGESSAVPFTQICATTNDSHVGQPLFYFSSHSTVSNQVNSSDPRTIPHVQASVDQTARQDGQDEKAQMNKTMPTLSTENLEHPHHVRSNSLPDFKPISDGPATLAAPPTEGYYANRSSSACSDRQQTPSPKQNQTGMNMASRDAMQNLNHSEPYASVMDQLNSALDKCAVRLDKKLYDDVRRKLDILGNQWASDSLLQEIKNRMVSLAKAITNGNYIEADQIHQSLIIDYSSEVSQWMVGIKKIITTCQETISLN